MDNAAKQQIVEQLAKMSFSNKPHQAYYLIKKKMPGGKGWHTVASIPANAETNAEYIDEEIWRCDDTWGGKGFYRISLYTNDDKKVNSFTDVKFSVGEVNTTSSSEIVYSDPNAEEFNIANLLKEGEKEEDDLEGLNTDMKKRIRFLQNQKFYNRLLENENGDEKGDKRPKKIEELQMEVRQMQENQGQGKILHVLERLLEQTGNKQGPGPDYMQQMMNMQQLQAEKAATAQQQQIERAEKNHQWQMDMEKQRQQWEREKYEREAAKPAAPKEKGMMEMMMLMEQNRQAQQIEMEKQKREDQARQERIQAEERRRDQEDKREQDKIRREDQVRQETKQAEDRKAEQSEKREWEKYKQEQDEKKPKITDFLNNPTTATLMAKVLERPVAPPTDWEKLMESPIALEVTKNLFQKDTTTSPMEQVLPTMMTTFTESFSALQSKVTDKLLEGAGHSGSPGEDEFTKKMKTIQMMSQSVLPHVTDLMERFAMILAARKGTSLTQVQAAIKERQKNQAQKSVTPEIDDPKIQHLMLALEQAEAKEVLEYIKNTQPKLLALYKQPKYAELVKTINNPKLTEFWSLMDA